MGCDSEKLSNATVTDSGGKLQESIDSDGVFVIAETCVKIQKTTMA